MKTANGSTTVHPTKKLSRAAVLRGGQPTSATLLRHGALLLILVFFGYSFVYLDVRFERLLEGMGRLGDLLADRYYPPDFSLIAQPDYLSSLLDTAQMAYLGALFGVLLSIPLGWFASSNMSPNRRWLYPAARGVMMASRAVHEMIWTVLLVSILGFGMLAGVLALTIFCTGFTAKLFAEQIEGIDPRPVEAVRAMGANKLQVFLFAVLPQVRVAWLGTAIYTWDLAFRAATVVGFFGAGGMGWYLLRYVQQLDNQRVAAILISIIVLVMLSEAVSAWARNRLARAR